jgi:hypothetical protein
VAFKDTAEGFLGDAAACVRWMNETPGSPYSATMVEKFTGSHIGMRMLRRLAVPDTGQVGRSDPGRWIPPWGGPPTVLVLLRGNRTRPLARRVPMRGLAERRRGRSPAPSRRSMLLVTSPRVDEAARPASRYRDVDGYGTAIPTRPLDKSAKGWSAITVVAGRPGA